MIERGYTKDKKIGNAYNIKTQTHVLLMVTKMTQIVMSFPVACLL